MTHFIGKKNPVTLQQKPSHHRCAISFPDVVLKIIGRGKWGYVEHGAKRNILLFVHETSFKTCFMQK
jgi:hypothetical protein